MQLKEILTFLCGVRDKTAIEIFMSKHREDHQCVHDLIKECLTVHSYSLLSDIMEGGHFTPDHHTISWAYSHEDDDKALVEVTAAHVKCNFEGPVYTVLRNNSFLGKLIL